MNWGCPYLEGEQCSKLKRACVPTQRGCELEGKVRLQAKPEGVAGAKTTGSISDRSKKGRLS